MEDVDKTFASVIRYRSCAVVQTLPYKERCNFVQQTKDCQDYKYLNYIQILYCTMRPSSDFIQIFCVALLMTLCLLFFVILAATVDKVFCPALKVVSKVMGLNEHMAGVTLLAFGNGSPDLISTFTSGDVYLSDIYGAALYVITVVTSVIFLIRPLQLQPSNILRDMCFFIFSCLTIDYFFLTDNLVTLPESVSILSIYLTYLVVLVLDQVLVKLSLRSLENRMKAEKYHTLENFDRLDQLRAEAFIEIVGRSSRASINVDLTRNVSYSTIGGKNDKLFEQLFHSLNPINADEWHEGGLVIKLYVIIQAPVVFFLALVIPIVDFELARHGWSKLLNALQISYFPVVLILILFGNSWRIYDIPAYFYTLLFTIPLTIYVLVTARTDIPPPYNACLCAYGVIASILIIFSVASEAVKIMEVLGIVCHCSIPFLNCTLQAWGNSIGDLVSSITLATHGYPRMAFAACFGGPFFNTIVSLGATSFYKIMQNPKRHHEVPHATLGENCVVFLLLALISVLVWALTNNFYARRSIGFFNITLYGLFFLFTLLGETQVIETYAPEVSPLENLI